MPLPGIHVSVAEAAASVPSVIRADHNLPAGARALNARPSNPAFSQEERAVLLLTPGIGRATVSRLERAGFTSLAEMRAAGVDAVVERTSAVAGMPVCVIRAQALAQAMGLVTRPAAVGGTGCLDGFRE